MVLAAVCTDDCDIYRYNTIIVHFTLNGSKVGMYSPMIAWLCRNT